MNARDLILAVVVALTASLVTEAAEGRMFRLPLAACIVEKSKDGNGWLEQGVVGVTYVQAEGQFKSSLSRDGWVFLHKVPLAGPNERALYSWKRGRLSVTLMLWRIDVGKTGFSWGVADADKSIHSKPKGTDK